MKLPYGISDFASLRRDGYHYQDRTGYLPVLESLGERYVIFLRPRRFGKSLWLSTLAHYYGLEHAGDFDWLFKGLTAGEQPTPLANSYLVLKFDFSRIETSNREKTRRGFIQNVRQGIADFLHKYAQELDEPDEKAVMEGDDAKELLDNLFLAVRKADTQHRIYLLIDEYDHFTNELIGRDLHHFEEIVTGTGYVRKFYETIKTATGQGTVERIFMTGVSPVTLDSLTSGFNIGAHFSRSPVLHDLMGFREDEVEALLGRLGEKQEDRIELLRSWYNGYRFEESAPRTLYNPDMVLYYLSQYQQRGHSPGNMLDTNIASDYGRIRQLFRLKGRETQHFQLLQKLLDEGQIVSPITQEFSFLKTFTDVDFLSLLYYMGLLTIGGNQLGIPRLRIPNKVIEGLYYAYFRDLINLRLDRVPEELAVQDTILALAEHNNPQPLCNLVAETLGQLSSRDFIQFNEASLKAIFISYLHSSQIYLIQPEQEVFPGYVDLLLRRREPFPAPHQFVFELKYLRKKEADRLEQVAAEARNQMQGYLQSKLLRDMPDLRAWVIVFVGTEVGVVEEVAK